MQKIVFSSCVFCFRCAIIYLVMKFRAVWLFTKKLLSKRGVFSLGVKLCGDVLTVLSGCRAGQATCRCSRLMHLLQPTMNFITIYLCTKSRPSESCLLFGGHALRWYMKMPPYQTAWRRKGLEQASIMCAVHKGDDLPTGTRFIGRECCCAGAGCNAFLYRPCHCLRIICVGRYIGKAGRFCGFGASGEFPHIGYCHSSCARITSFVCISY